MRTLILIVITSVMVVGCAARTPVAPETGKPSLATQQRSPSDDPHRLFGEYSLFINEAHDKVDVVPRREARFHLNALKFLESYCADCLKITGLKNNGDSTIDLTVQIKHPFPGHPQYSGFDVKGIIMFDGSWENEGYFTYLPYPEPFRVSWRKLGDPQVLNADGYTIRWSPTYDSGSDLPIYNYWEGKYASGTPTANVNAFLNFYTTENRHIFNCNGQVSRTYHIWVPQGQPIVAGYAVEACWEPPLKTPVIDPASDFPVTANQPEAYEFRYVLNNNQPITDPDCCGDIHDPTAHVFSKQWNGHTATSGAFFTGIVDMKGGEYGPCGDEWPDQYCGSKFNAPWFPDGDYIGVAINFGPPAWPLPVTSQIAYTIFEFTIDLQ